MPQQNSGTRHIGRVGWFAVGALAASLAFVMLAVAGDYFQAMSGDEPTEAQLPTLIIEGN